jgi:hypothetical protein
MSTRLFRVGFAIMLAGGLALPACKKKDDAPTNPTPTPGGTTPSSGTPAAGDGKWSKDGAEYQTSQKNLKHIGLAVHQHNDTWDGVPVGIMPDGKSIGLSWRVALLPYLDQEALYKEFNLKEPWDSEHNKKLIEKMPAVYALPGAKAEAGLTPYRAFVGPKTNMPDWAVKNKGALPPGYLARARFSAVQKRWSKTAFAAEVTETVTWTKPDDLRLTPDGSPPKLDGPYAEGTNILMWDGRPYFLPKDTPAETVKALIDITSDPSFKLP